MRDISVAAAVRTSLKIFSGHRWNFVSLGALVVLVGLPAFVLQLQKGPLIALAAAYAVVFVIGGYLRLGLLKLALAAEQHGRLHASYAIPPFSLFLKYIASEIVYYAIVLIGLIALVIPGIYFALRFFFWDYFLVDRGAGPLEALRISWRVTRNKFPGLLRFGLVLLVLLVVGFLTFGIGHLFALPFSVLLGLAVFRQLTIKGYDSQKSQSKPS